MQRTIGTIVTSRHGIGQLIHDDITGELICRTITSDLTVDFPTNKSWRQARKFAERSWGNRLAYHDSWVLCLRPIQALRVMRTEARGEK